MQRLLARPLSRPWARSMSTDFASQIGKNEQSVNASIFNHDKEGLAERLLGTRHDKRRYRPWTAEESRLLTDAVLEQLNASSSSENKQQQQQSTQTPTDMIQWTRVADSVRTRTKEECCNRWYRHLQPGIKWGRWTAEEDALLRAMVDVYGRQQWSAVARHMAGRTDLQCVFRWQLLEQADRVQQQPGSAQTLGHSQTMEERGSLRGRRLWTLEQSQMAVLMTRQFGRKWKTISNQLFVIEPRAASQVRVHYDVTLRARIEQLGWHASIMEKLQELMKNAEPTSIMEPITRFPENVNPTVLRAVHDRLRQENQSDLWISLGRQLDLITMDPHHLALVWQFVRPMQQLHE